MTLPLPAGQAPTGGGSATLHPIRTEEPTMRVPTHRYIDLPTVVEPREIAEAFPDEDVRIHEDGRVSVPHHLEPDVEDYYLKLARQRIK